MGTAGLPHVIVRFFTVKRSSRCSEICWMGHCIYCKCSTLPHLTYWRLLQEQIYKPYESLPEWFSNWETTGLLTFTDKNKDGLVQYVSDPKTNELVIDKDIIVMANPEIANLPNWVIGLMAAGALAAALSTAAGLLLVISSSVSHDLLKKIVYPSISEKGELVAARIAAIFAVILAGYFGINPPDFVAATVALAFGLAAASFFQQS